MAGVAMSCTKHAWTSRPGLIYVRHPGTQHICGELHFHLCCECGRIEGHVTNASLFQGSGNLPFEAEIAERDLEAKAYAILSAAGGVLPL